MLLVGCFEFEMVVLLLQFAMLHIILQHLLHIKSILPQGLVELLLPWAQRLLQSGCEFPLLRVQRVLLGRSTHQRMVEGLLIHGHVLAGVGVDVEGLQVVAVHEPVSLVGGVVSPVVLEALPVEVLAEGGV